MSRASSSLEVVNVCEWVTSWHVEVCQPSICALTNCQVCPPKRGSSKSVVNEEVEGPKMLLVDGNKLSIDIGSNGLHTGIRVYTECLSNGSTKIMCRWKKLTFYKMGGSGAIKSLFLFGYRKKLIVWCELIIKAILILYLVYFRITDTIFRMQCSLIKNVRN